MKRTLSVLTFLSLATVLGCQTEVPKIGSNSSSAPEKAEKVILTRLQQADALDGEEDKIVHKCYVCALGMDGKEQHSATYEGYTAHLCSAGCKKTFEKDPESVVAKTEIPSKDKN